MPDNYQPYFLDLQITTNQMETKKSLSERLDENKNKISKLLLMTTDKSVDIKSKAYLEFKKEVNQEHLALMKEVKELPGLQPTKEI